MDHRAIRDVLRSQPFRPFRMRLNDGREYDVRHPDYLAIGEHGRQIVHIDPGRDDAMTIIEPLLIATIEYLQPVPPPPPSGNGNAGATGS